MPRIILATGGTGGHLLPAQSVGEKLALKGAQILITGAHLKKNRCFDSLLPFQEISAAPLRRASFIKDAWMILKGVKESIELIRNFKPDFVVGFGSFHTLPVLVAAALMRKRIVLFESNAIAGKVNRFFSRYAEAAAISLLEAQHSVHCPARHVIMPTKGRDRIGKEAARRHFGLHPDRLTILVFGGSLGAAAINEAFLQSAEKLLQLGIVFQVLHMTGSSEAACAAASRYKDLGIEACVKSFEKEMTYAWEAADLAVCRAGGATSSEILEFEVPSLLIPYPLATDDHQTKNALYLEKKVGGALLVKEISELPFFLERMCQGERRHTMSLALSSFKESTPAFSLQAFLEELLSYTNNRK